MLIFIVLVIFCHKHKLINITPSIPPSPNSQIGTLTNNGLRVLSILYEFRAPVNPHELLTTVDDAYSAGVRGSEIRYQWNILEPSPGKYDFTSLKKQLAYFGTTRHMTLYLNIATIQTIKRQVPADLQDIPFDSPIMENRFHGFINALVPVLTPEVTYIGVGNEVNQYLSAHNEWNAYTNFLTDTIAYFHQVAPNIKIGTPITFSGLTKFPSQNANLINASDVAIFTYYPQDSNFQVLDSAAPLTDLPKMIQAANGKLVILQEAGYQSSTRDNSSPEKQATFVHNLFLA